MTNAWDTGNEMYKYRGHTDGLVEEDGTPVR